MHRGDLPVGRGLRRKHDDFGRKHDDFDDILDPVTPQAHAVVRAELAADA
jgi:hypothetical protein